MGNTNIVAEREYEDKQALPSVLSRMLEAQGNLKPVIRFLEELVSSDQGDEDHQRERIRDLVESAGTAVTKDFAQFVINLMDLETWAPYPSVTNYVRDITDITNEMDKLVPSVELVPDEHGQRHPSQDFTSTIEKLRIIPHAPGASSTLADLEEIRRRAKEHLDIAKTIRREIGKFTIPLRIRFYMEKLAGVGAPLDFHAQFKDELTDPEDRVAVLRKLATYNPTNIGGMVDIGRGMIYRIGSPRRILESYLVLLAVAGLGALVVFLLSSGNLEIAGFALEPPFSDLWLLYVLTGVGVVAHIIKKSSELSIAEQSQTVVERPLVILDQLPLWIHVREVRFAGTIATAILAFLFLASAGQLDSTKALLAGYSIDSISDMVFQRFNTAVSQYTLDVKKAFAPEAK
jgi:hypothetical protein